MSRHKDLQEIYDQILTVLEETGVILDETKQAMHDKVSEDPVKLSEFLKDPTYDKLSSAAFMAFYGPRLDLGKATAEKIIGFACDAEWNHCMGALYKMRETLNIQKTRAQTQLEGIRLVSDAMDNAGEEWKGHPHVSTEELPEVEPYQEPVDPFAAAKKRMRGDNPGEMN